MLRKRLVLVLLAALAVTGCGKKSSLYLQPGRESGARAESAPAHPTPGAVGNSN
jgi:predicted small lipoprotein YifL